MTTVTIYDILLLLVDLWRWNYFVCFVCSSWHVFGHQIMSVNIVRRKKFQMQICGQST